MKFVEEHLTKHHLFRKPHKWFLAFLSSPLHAAEMHYKRKYHLTFRHAKKLFFFDMSLLVSIILLIGGTIFWFGYDPTVTDLVQLQIRTTDNRLASGDSQSFAIHIENNSSVSLADASLAMSFPDGFVLAEAPEAADGNLLAIDTLAPGESRSFRYAGDIFATPGADETIMATLSYRQADRQAEEVKVARIVNTVRDSRIQLTTQFPDRLIAGTTVPVSLSVQNESDRALPISIPLPLGNGLSLVERSVSTGSSTPESWDISSLAPGETAQLTASLRVDVPADTTTLSARLAASIYVNETYIPQGPVDASFQILHPGLSGSVSMSAGRTQPGTNLTATIQLQNTGDSTLTDVIVLVPVDRNTINSSRFASQNIGRFVGNDFRIDATHNAGLLSLEPGASRSIELSVPLRSYIAGEDISFRLSPRMSASIEGISSRIERPIAPGDAVAVGTSLSVSAESRYYTNEGDQLGRGPLPPRVGKETKYWAIIRIDNSSSRVNDVVLRATLPAGVSWTERSSVSHGAPVVYNEGNREITWQLNDMWAGQSAGINAELSVTPGANAVGNHLPLLQNIRISGFDSYIQEQLSASTANIATDLPQDSLGRKRGTAVR